MSKIKQIDGLGSAAALDAGTGANELVQLDGSGRIPAVDGSQLTGVSGGGTTTAALLPIVNVTSTNYNVASSTANGTVFYLDTYGSGQLITYLPAASAVSAGTSFTFARNDGGNYGYVMRAGYPGGTDTLQGANTGYQLFSNASITLISDGSSNWIYGGLGTQ